MEASNQMTSISAEIAPVPQRVRWESHETEGRVGMVTETDREVGFVPWSELKPELEKKLLIQLGRVLGNRKCTVETAEFHGRKDWLIRIVDEKGNAVGSVWLGGDPDQGWKWDGQVRVGNAPTEHTARVWQIFARYSDGSYRRIMALDTPEDRLPDK